MVKSQPSGTEVSCSFLAPAIALRSEHYDSWQIPKCSASHYNVMHTFKSKTVSVAII